MFLPQDKARIFSMTVSIAFISQKNQIIGMFFSESTDVFVITPNRPTFVFPETENLNFGDRKLLRN